MTGFVSLVGAGPGDPELLTIKAARRLNEADLVLHDALVSPEILALAPKARAFDVGKRARRKSTPQDVIHRIMIHAARRGQRVVRLKGGDPFVLGRGGEEALALAAAGIPFEVIPGLSSAVAAPALAGIPVTHRGLTSGFMVVSGHAAAVLPSLTGGGLTQFDHFGRADGSRQPSRAFRVSDPAWLAAGDPGRSHSRSVDAPGRNLGEPARRVGPDPAPGIQRSRQRPRHAGHWRSRFARRSHRYRRSCFLCIRERSPGHEHSHRA